MHSVSFLRQSTLSFQRRHIATRTLPPLARIPEIKTHLGKDLRNIKAVNLSRSYTTEKEVKEPQQNHFMLVLASVFTTFCSIFYYKYNESKNHELSQSEPSYKDECGLKIEAHLKEKDISALFEEMVEFSDLEALKSFIDLLKEKRSSWEKVLIETLFHSAAFLRNPPENLKKRDRYYHSDEMMKRFGKSYRHKTQEEFDQKHLETLRLIKAIIPLIEKEKIKEFVTPHYYSVVGRGDIELFKALKEIGVPFPEKHGHDTDLFLKAILKHQNLMTKYLVQEEGYNINGVYQLSLHDITHKEADSLISRSEENKVTPAYLAVLLDNPILLQFLMEIGADCNTLNAQSNTVHSKNTPLVYSIASKSRCTEILLASKSVDRKLPGIYGVTPKQAAALVSDDALVNKLK